MNKKHSFKAVVAVLGVATLVAVPVMAKPVLQKITAYMNSGITYTLDGNRILGDVSSVTYKDKTYVPIEDIAKALGKEVTLKNGQVILTTPKEEVAPLPDQMVIEKAKIIEVNQESKQVTILPAGQPDKRENYMVLNVGKETTIRHELLKKVVIFDDLEVGMTIKAIHSPISTASLPPQTPAFEIVVLGEKVVTDSNQTEIDDAKIIEINHSQKYLVVKNKVGTYTVNFTNKTKVEFEDHHKKPNVNSLKVGQVVDIELKNGVATEIEVEKN